jgi:hypothetical protein
MVSNGVRPTWRWKTTPMCRASGANLRQNCTNVAGATEKRFKPLLPFFFFSLFHLEKNGKMPNFAHLEEYV